MTSTLILKCYNTCFLHVVSSLQYVWNNHNFKIFCCVNYKTNLRIEKLLLKFELCLLNGADLYKFQL